MKKRNNSKQIQENVQIPVYKNDGYEVSLPGAYEHKNLISISKIYTFFTAIRSPGVVWEPECHTAWEMVYVINGTISEIADNNTYTLYKGDVIFHKPMEFHKLCPDLYEKSEVLIVSFDVEGTLSYRLKNLVFHTEPPASIIMNALLGYMDYYRKKYNVYYDEEWNKNEIGMLSYLTYFKNIDALQPAIHLLESFLVTVATVGHTNIPHSPREYDGTTIKVIQMLEEHISGWVTIDDIASLLGVSAKTLQIHFKENTGYTIHKYFMNIKMRYAIDLLKSGKKVGEVSDLLGFCNSNYFSQVFYRETGKSASSYK